MKVDAAKKELLQCRIFSDPANLEFVSNFCLIWEGYKVPHRTQQDGLLAGYYLNKIMNNQNCYFSTAKQKVEEYIQK